MPIPDAVVKESDSDWFSQPVVRIDRSTAETAATCPRRSLLLERYKTLEDLDAAHSGSEAHEAIAKGIALWVQKKGDVTRDEIIDAVFQRLITSRPDLQPDVIDSTRYSLHEFARFLMQIDYENIMAYDGGTGDHHAQFHLDLDVNGTPVVFTSELDFLYAGPGSPEIIYEVDWKTGRWEWTASEIAESFQFQAHAALVLGAYPKCNQVSISVWNTRSNKKTAGVLFDRKRLWQYESRIRTACLDYIERERAEARPGASRCAQCPVAHKCDIPDDFTKLVAEAPGLAVDALVVLEAKVKQITKLLSAKRDALGADIAGEKSGSVFGREKPASTRKPAATLYSAGGDE